MNVGQRIIIIGITGSGKSTLAKQLVHLFNATHIELDGLFWRERWTGTPDDEFEQAIVEAIHNAGNRWVVDGNYSRTRKLIWTGGDTLIWLDYPLHIIYWRLIRRTLYRVFSQQALWQGNRETFKNIFLSRNSILLWAWTSYKKRHTIYTAIISNEFPNLTLLHFTQPQQTEMWLKQLQEAFRPY